MIKSLREKGSNVIIDCENSNLYLQRINFFRELEVDAEEFFQRHDSTGRFLEISLITKEDSSGTVTRLVKILEKQMQLSPKMAGCINFCFWEVVDNIQLHAQSPIGGYVVAQYYPKKNVIEIIVVDTGRGIYASLTQNPAYQNMSEDEALRSSIKQEVTSGDGRGNGLYYTAKFIRKCRGNLTIYSGGCKLHLGDSNIYTREVPYWQGTIIYMEIKTDVLVDMHDIFGDEIPVTIEEYEDLF